MLDPGVEVGTEQEQGGSSVESWLKAIPAVLAMVGQWFGGGGEQSQELQESDVLSLMRRILPGMTPEEQMLAALQMSLAGQAFRGAAGGEVGGLTLESLMRGELPGASRTRIHEQAFAPVNEGIRMALRRAEEGAAARGVPLSTIQSGYEAELIRPLLAQAAQTEAGLGMGELERLGGLRERALANMLAMQQSPALERLLGLRMAEAEERQLQITRKPGELPPENRIGRGFYSQRPGGWWR